MLKEKKAICFSLSLFYHAMRTLFGCTVDGNLKTVAMVTRKPHGSIPQIALHEDSFRHVSILTSSRDKPKITALAAQNSLMPSNIIDLSQSVTRKWWQWTVNNHHGNPEKLALQKVWLSLCNTPSNKSIYLPFYTGTPFARSKNFLPISEFSDQLTNLLLVEQYIISNENPTDQFGSFFLTRPQNLGNGSLPDVSVRFVVATFYFTKCHELPFQTVQPSCAFEHCTYSSKNQNNQCSMFCKWTIGFCQWFLPVGRWSNLFRLWCFKMQPVNLPRPLNCSPSTFPLWDVFHSSGQFSSFSNIWHWHLQLISK